MSRKLAVVLIAIVVATAFAASMAIAGDPPAQVTIDKSLAKKGAVTFDHAKHSETIDCMKCHHKAASKEEVKSCFECHGKDPAANDPASGKADNPFHVQCKGCHKEQAKGPTKCKECHGGAK
ncbi:MAG: cytochrome c3 family protein [bacterium]|nr:cytochrome c3 family protein [bacterium]